MLYDAFTSIYKKYIDTDDEYKIVSVLKSLDHLWNEETIVRILKYLEPELKQSYDNLESVKDALKFQETGYEYIVMRIDRSINQVTEYVLNSFTYYEMVREYREKIINVCLDIAEFTSKNNPYKNHFIYAVNEVLVNRLVKFNKNDSQQIRYDAQLKKINHKRNNIDIRYKLGVGFVIILLLLRIVTRCN